MLQLLSLRRFPAAATLAAALLATIPSAAFAQLYWNAASHFSGSPASYILAPHSASLDIKGSFTIECWVRTDTSGPTHLAELVAKAPHSGAFSTGYELLLDNNRPRVRTNGTTKLIGHTVISPMIWSHVAATFDSASNTFTTYVNGLLDSSFVIAGGAPLSNTDSLFVGTGFNGPYAGDIDEVRIWNRALTQVQIDKNMHTSLSTTGGAYSNMVLSYPFQRPYPLPVGGVTGTDYSGHGNQIAALNNVTPVEQRTTPATYISNNQSLDLDGTGSYAAGPSTAEINITGSFTLECWVFPRLTQPAATVIQKRQGGNAVGYTLYLATGHANVRTNTSTQITSRDSIPAGRWTHIAGVYDAAGTKFMIYLNGRLDTTVTASASPSASTDSLYVGTGFNGPFNGYIDEVRISNYARSAAEIKKYLYCSMDYSNFPPGTTTNAVYSFDGVTWPTDQYGPTLSLFGNAQFSSPAYFSNVPLAPLLRADNLNFPAGFYMKKSAARIPTTGTSGTTLPDSLYIGQNVNISDVKLFVAINHTAEADLQISLISPSHDSVMVDNQRGLAGANDNLITIFNDGADSSIISSSRYMEFGPTIRPQNPLNTAFAGKNAQGYWILKLNDAATADTGRLYSWGIQINNQVLVGVTEPPNGVPGKFRLDQNYPNPFNPSTTIRYALPGTSHVQLVVYDLLGRRVAVLADGQQSAGEHSVRFDAARLASGVYLCRLTAGSFVETKKMMVVK
jgi:subtilisin-like proprotein convertase family protein